MVWASGVVNMVDVCFSHLWRAMQCKQCNRWQHNNAALVMVVVHGGTMRIGEALVEEFIMISTCAMLPLCCALLCVLCVFVAAVVNQGLQGGHLQRAHCY